MWHYKVKIWKKIAQKRHRFVIILILLFISIVCLIAIVNMENKILGMEWNGLVHSLKINI